MTLNNKLLLFIQFVYSLVKSMCSAMEWVQCIYPGVYTGWGGGVPVFCHGVSATYIHRCVHSTGWGRGSSCVCELGWMVERTWQGTPLLRGTVACASTPPLAYFIEICISYYAVSPLCLSRSVDGCKWHLPRRAVRAILITCLNLV